MSDRFLFAFVDPKDPYMTGEVAGEDLPGPILSMLAAREFDTLFLFHTPKTAGNASATAAEVNRVAPGCRAVLHELAIADPKDYSALMRALGRRVRDIVRSSPSSQNFICVSSGTAECAPPGSCSPLRVC
ncbi:MAG TPA: hypothetical protein VL285_18270 [Bryobacteraceae bacterium]|jgi:hypothetical protein|nr:hypothetical protein [Bryobacteraceae bacterium]